MAKWFSAYSTLGLGCGEEREVMFIAYLMVGVTLYFAMVLFLDEKIKLVEVIIAAFLWPCVFGAALIAMLLERLR